MNRAIMMHSSLLSLCKAMKGIPLPPDASSKLARCECSSQHPPCNRTHQKQVSHVLTDTRRAPHQLTRESGMTALIGKAPANIFLRPPLSFLRVPRLKREELPAEQLRASTRPLPPCTHASTFNKHLVRKALHLTPPSPPPPLFSLL